MQPFITSAGELARLYVAIIALGGTAEDIRRYVNVSGFEGLLEGFEEDVDLAIVVSELCPDKYMERADYILANMVSIEPQTEDRDMVIARGLTMWERETIQTARWAEEAYLRHVA